MVEEIKVNNQEQNKNKTKQDVEQLIFSRGGGKNAQQSTITVYDYKILFPTEADFNKLDLIGQGGFAQVRKIKIDSLEYAIKRTYNRGDPQELINSYYQELEALSLIKDDRILNLIGVAMDWSN